MRKASLVLITILMVLGLLVSTSASAIGNVFAQSGEPSPTPLPTVPVATSNSVDSSDQSFHWDLTIQVNPEFTVLSQAEQSELSEPLQALGVAAVFGNGQLVMQGNGDASQLQSAMFDSQVPGLDFLSGPVELSLSLPSDGTPLTLTLESRITTGYLWELIPGDGISYVQSSSTLESRYVLDGAPAVQTLVLTPLGEGAAVVKLVYRRPFEVDTTPHARVNVSFANPVSTLDLSDPSPKTDAEVLASKAALEITPGEHLAIDTALPPSFDWRTSGALPAIRNQGGCGSCWAFAAVGVMEAAVKIGGGPTVDLSEQFLVDCAYTSYGCDGGYTEHKFHYNTLGLNQSVVGAVLESDKAYLGIDSTCNVIQNHDYKLSDWDYITYNLNPTVAELKTAIATYGPIKVSVCAGPAFSSYKSGVFQTTENVCNGYTNHAVVLVGWDDATESWILRNSWGANWGMSGYMNIKWGTSKVGMSPSWVIYTAPVAELVTYTPDKDVFTRYPAYTWSRIPGVDFYTLAIYDKVLLKNVYRKTISSSVCSAITNRCVFTPNKQLTINRPYRWKVAASSGTVDGTFTTWRPFTPR
jgi:C1A family cysteine protease